MLPSVQQRQLSKGHLPSSKSGVPSYIIIMHTNYHYIFRRNWQMLKVLQIFLEHTLDYIPAKAIQCAAVMHRVH